MRIVRFVDPDGLERHGERVDDRSARVIEGDLFGEFRVTDDLRPIGKLLAPLLPRAILCIGLNYRQHAAETGARLPEYPVLFFKAPGALQNPGDPIVIPAVEPVEVDYECELAFVIGRAGKNIPREQALDHVLGYTCANDVSGRRWQKSLNGKQWCRGKSFDTFCPLGPDLVTRDALGDAGQLGIRTILNGEVMQDSSTSDMIFDVPALVSFLSEGTTLLPGMLVLTGTPQGVGFARDPQVFLRAGDTVVIEIDGIGRLENPVVGEGE
jgi:2-keto-4-pentenoate hydratase/2-oxohepta-3-ene-1,7-dioic acid hydratase in catechol pathway